MPPRKSLNGSERVSPPRTPDTMSTEVLYNTAVQAFVRRDHVKTQATLARLLAQLKRTSAAPLPKWYELEAVSGGGTESPSASGHASDEMLVKTLKLVISANTSLYTDPPHHTSGLPDELMTLLPPTPPDQLLSYTYDQLRPFCPDLLPPALLSTILLASLKLKPAKDSLNYAHQLSEDWLAALPDAFVLAISPAAPKRHQGDTIAAVLAAERKRRVESAREGYLKVVELFVGEVLAREGEYEMARAFLDGEIVMSSKRKESLYKHLRTSESRAAPSPSPSASLILPSPTSSGVLVPHPSPSSRSRSRSASTSSSSSEATARPQLGGGSAAQSPASRLAVPSKYMSSGRDNTASSVPRQLAKSLGLNKGKHRAAAGAAAAGGTTDRKDEEDSATGTAPSVASESTLPSKIYVNHGTSEASTSGGHGDRHHYRNGRGRDNDGRRADASADSVVSSVFSAILRTLPAPVSRRLARMGRYALFGIAIPLPIIVLLTLALWIRRKQQRIATALASSAAEGVAYAAAGAAAGASVVAPSAVEELRAKIRRVREQGLMNWMRWFLRWWIDKFVGVWRMGTAITYV